MTRFEGLGGSLHLYQYGLMLFNHRIGSLSAPPATNFLIDKVAFESSLRQLPAALIESTLS
jgi:hypothetical protein